MSKKPTIADAIQWHHEEADALNKRADEAHAMQAYREEEGLRTRAREHWASALHLTEMVGP